MNPIVLAPLVLAATPIQADLPLPAVAPAPSAARGPAPAEPLDAEPADTSPSGDPAWAGEDGGEIVVIGNPAPPPGDPLARFNARTFEATQAVDAALVEPLAEGYEKGVPRPVRSGLRNFFRNLTSPVVFLNFLLQLKPQRAIETLARFAINTTAGVAGLFDVAGKEPFDLPYRPNGLANTLGYYGVGPGPYFYLPLVGSTTLRDAFGGLVDGLVLPIAVGAPFDDPKFALPRGAIRSLDYRVEYDEQIDALLEEDDPYTTQRERYLAARQAEIDALRGARQGAEDSDGTATGTDRTEERPDDAVAAPGAAPLAQTPEPEAQGRGAGFSST